VDIEPGKGSVGAEERRTGGGECISGTGVIVAPADIVAIDSDGAPDGTDAEEEKAAAVAVDGVVVVEVVAVGGRGEAVEEPPEDQATEKEKEESETEVGMRVEGEAAVDAVDDAE
jgi:hypothetical protein